MWWAIVVMFTDWFWPWECKLWLKMWPTNNVGFSSCMLANKFVIVFNKNIITYWLLVHVLFESKYTTKKWGYLKKDIECRELPHLGSCGWSIITLQQSWSWPLHHISCLEVLKRVCYMYYMIIPLIQEYLSLKFLVMGCFLLQVIHFCHFWGTLSGFHRHFLA